MKPKRKLESEQPAQKVNIKCTIVGEPAEIFLELKRRGIIRSSRDAFTQGLMCLHDRVLHRDLKVAQLKTSKRLSEEF
jgi:hypothetical protein